MFSTSLGSGARVANSFALEMAFKQSADNSKKDKRRRIRNNDPSSESFSGPWGGFDDEEHKARKLEEESEIRHREDDTLPLASASEKGGENTCDIPERVTSIFHGKDNQSWLSVPAKNKSSAGSSSGQLPRKLVHTWKGHNGGVQCIKFFPQSGHLLLSCSLDSRIKIWDAHSDKECRMTYTGHSQGVRDVSFTRDGSRFYSAAFDTMVHLWDTETGKIINSFSNNKIPFCVSVHPKDDDSIIVGNQICKAIQYDAKSGKVVQEYNEHLGAVNSVTFCQDGNKLVTTSEDRKIFVWTYGIPVVEKYIAEPHFHSVPAVTLHPNQPYLVGQSMNNSIIVYQTSDLFVYQSKKRFFGHSNTGYAIRPGFSNDGKFLTSGSSDGSVFFWDWKSAKMYRSFKAHDGVCMGSVWQPLTTSRMATCGWDGLIKLWE
jgi:pre-mRNA-processing factor 17